VINDGLEHQQLLLLKHAQKIKVDLMGL